MFPGYITIIYDNVPKSHILREIIYNNCFAPRVISNFHI
jgi:hypothetical protein